MIGLATDAETQLLHGFYECYWCSLLTMRIIPLIFS